MHHTPKKKQTKRPERNDDCVTISTLRGLLSFWLLSWGAHFFHLAPTDTFRKGPPFPRWSRGPGRPTLDMSNNFSSILTHANRVLLLPRLVLVVVSRFSLFRLLRGQSPQGLSLTHSRNNLILFSCLDRFRTFLMGKGPASFCFRLLLSSFA